jgi:ALMS motif
MNWCKFQLRWTCLCPLGRRPRIIPMHVCCNCRQEAFDATMADFVSRSRERQRYVLLRAEERRIQELEANERQRLFGVGHRRSTNTVADPAAGELCQIARFDCIRTMHFSNCHSAMAQCKRVFLSYQQNWCETGSCTASFNHGGAKTYRRRRRLGFQLLHLIHCCTRARSNSKRRLLICCVELAKLPTCCQ